MAGEKFIQLVNGQFVEKQSPQTAVANQIPSLDTNGRWLDSMMPVGIAPEIKTAPAYEALGAGDFINMFDDSGTLKMRKADCSNGRRAHGFVLSAFDSGATATMYFEGNNTGVSGRTKAAIQYLSTAGDVTETAPSTAGYMVQELGTAVSATEMNFEPKSPITLAS